MPQVKIYQGGTVERGPANTTPLQPGNFSESGLGQGLEIAGRAGGELVNTQDQIQAIHDQQQAQELSLEHLETVKNLDTTVRQAQGMNAMPAAQQAASQLQQTKSDLLSQARSGRARRMLMADIIPRSADAMTSWENHGFEQQRTAVIATNKALTDSTINTAAQIPEEPLAQATFSKTNDYVDQQAAFLGLAKPVADQMKRENATRFYVSRAQQVVANPSGGSASQAISYLSDHRSEINDDDYNRFVGSYHERAVKEDARGNVDRMLAGMGDVRAGGYTGTPVRGVAGGPSPQGMVKPDGTLDPHAFFTGAVSKWEGGYTIDVNGAPVNHGVNGAAHPGVDIKNLTVGRAADIMAKDYFTPFQHLPAAMAAVAGDTAFINPTKAKQFLAEAGGDPQHYMDLREHWMAALEKADPGKYGRVARGWANRNAQLRNLAAQLTPAPQPEQTAEAQPPAQPGQAPTASDAAPASQIEQARVPTTPTPGRPFSYDDAIASIRNSSNYAPEMKEAMISDLRERRGEEVRASNQNKQEAEQDAMGQIVNLGDKFTDIGQIDPHTWQSLDPNSQYRFQKMAESNANGESHPLKATDAEFIEYTRRANPDYFTSPGFQADLAKRGVPQSTIVQVAREAGAMAGEKAAQSPKYHNSTQLWTIAKPMFEEAGLHFDTSETAHGNKTGREAERRADAEQKLQALNYLSDVERRWATQNPGKVADDGTVRGWVAQALIGNSSLRRYNQDRAGVVRDLAPDVRARIVRSLRAHGQPVNNDTVYDAYKTVVALNGGRR